MLHSVINPPSRKRRRGLTGTGPSFIPRFPSASGGTPAALHGRRRRRRRLDGGRRAAQERAGVEGITPARPRVVRLVRGIGGHVVVVGGLVVVVGGEMGGATFPSGWGLRRRRPAPSTAAADAETFDVVRLGGGEVLGPLWGVACDGVGRGVFGGRGREAEEGGTRVVWRRGLLVRGL